ncbi:MAG TPA: DUF6390 family protein [Micromonosporaceae bacterium]|nr:DUF6390 family protein [Micromonosporaceae bacterium]
MTGGAVLFARYAYPPNALGYCGPGDPAALLGYANAGVADGGLVALARQFAGAWPYLALIAAANGRADPLDPAVVEAYWIGNRLLHRVPPGLFAAHLRDRFEERAGRGFPDLAELAVVGGVPHHNFHVFAVYPWVGLLRAGRADEPMRVLDSCRVRWATVLTLHSGLAEVMSQPLTWDGRRLSLGTPEVRLVTVATAGDTLAPRVRVGDTVSVHWDWICDVLSPLRVARLRHYTLSQLRLVNDALRRPVAAAVLDS